VPGEELADLRRRIAAARWPSRELVDDRSQGVQLATIQELARYWATEYDWSRCEARLNALPQFTTDIDGVGVHFIHVKSPHADAMPLIMTHGWPGSVIELLESVGPLTDPTSHGAGAEDAFHLVLPSIPGYGFSAEPAEDRLVRRPRRASAGGADAPSRLHPLRRPGRRPGRLRHRRDGPPGT
jgi:Epoxide hydrolase N terminus